MSEIVFSSAVNSHVSLTHIRIDFRVTDSKWAFAVQYDSAVSGTLIKVLLCVCAARVWADWAFIAAEM